MALSDQLHDHEWTAALHAEFEKAYFRDLESFLRSNGLGTEQVVPPEPLVFRALNDVPLSSVRAVIVGQDPYQTPGWADGLAFSAPTATHMPQALANILGEIERDIGEPIVRRTDLSSWAAEGVLMLNTVLTTNSGRSRSHSGEGWETFTRAVLTAVRDHTGPAAILLWGKDANDLFGDLWVGTRHRLIARTYPGNRTASRSYANLRPLRGGRSFIRANCFLDKANRGIIDWAPRA